MGRRTYIYDSAGSKIACLGKLVAYTTDPSKDLPNIKKWCDNNITNEDDRIYLFGGTDEDGDYWEGYFNIGYCRESIIFHERFNRQQIADFVTAFIRDNANGPFPNFCSDFYRELGDVLSSDTEFEIEWTEGG